MKLYSDPYQAPEYARSCRDKDKLFHGERAENDGCTEA